MITCSFGRLISTWHDNSHRTYYQFEEVRQNKSRYLPSYPIFQDEARQGPTRLVCAESANCEKFSIAKVSNTPLPICGHNDLDLAQDLESVKLIQ